MSEKSKGYWQMDLEEYIRQGEPEQSERSIAWRTAIGLQDVDGLKTSDYLLETAKEHIEGKIDIKTVQKKIQSYYEERQIRTEAEEGTKEADIVSTRITELLGERTFQFSPAEWKTIHGRLFRGVLDRAGEYRTYNITKNEWVLNGDTVIYASADSIKPTLDYDFGQEKAFSYEGLSALEAVRHIAKFTSGIWQIHPFCEGNTRATAVFIIKYLKTFGFHVSNDVFAENSWYFRNALVRSNYSNMEKGIAATTKYLECFFENLLLGYQNELKNRYIHVDYTEIAESEIQSANVDVSKCKNCTLEELAIIKEISMNPELTTILSQNPRYAAAYHEFLEAYKNGYGKNNTEEEMAEFEKFLARDFLNGIKKDSNERVVLIGGERLLIRRARIADADFMQSVELDADNSPWVANWSLGWRITKLGDEDFLQTVIEKTDGTPIGILIFRGMRTIQDKLELKRIALIEKGKGYGKEAIYLAQRLAFDVFGTPYLYLGTKDTNTRAQSIYKATGFTPDMPDPCTAFHITVEAYREKKQG